MTIRDLAVSALLLALRIMLPATGVLLGVAVCVLYVVIATLMLRAGIAVVDLIIPSTPTYP